MKVKLLISFFFAASSSSTSLAQVITLPNYNVDQFSITVSGVSSGAAFASQFHMAFSEDIQGSGVWAGIVPFCYARAFLGCMSSPATVSLWMTELFIDTNYLASIGKIDDTINLIGDRVYIHHGTQDEVVDPGISPLIQDYFLHYIPDSSAVIMKNDLPANHAMVLADDRGGPCGTLETYTYMENCGFDSVYAMMNHVRGGGVSFPGPPGSYDINGLFEFDQTEFLPNNDPYSYSMADTGYVYVPLSCQSGFQQCAFHAFFHGCAQGSYVYANGIDLIISSNLLEIAEVNDIIVLFPQLIPREKVGLDGVNNPYGCWDWFGYLGDLFGDEYATKDGIQMRAVYEMMQRISGI